MDAIFQPLQFRNLTVKNRVFCSNISGRFDNYDGPGNQARINWETKFARGGVGAIISSFVPVMIQGRIIPGYATIYRDDRIPFGRRLGERVHEYDCKYILQLSHSGRQRDIAGVETEPQVALSSTSMAEPLHGFACHAHRLRLRQSRVVSSGPEAEQGGFRFDTSVRGNSNSGHVYGTDLTPEQKALLLEFMKTL